MSDTGMTDLERLHEITIKLVNPELAISLINSLPDALVVVNESAQIVLFNYQAELLFGYTKPEVMGKDIEVLVPEGIREGHVRDRNGYIEDPRIRPMGQNKLLLARHKSGRALPVEVNLAPVMTLDGLFIMAAIRRRKEHDGGGT